MYYLTLALSAAAFGAAFYYVWEKQFHSTVKESDMRLKLMEIYLRQRETNSATGRTLAMISAALFISALFMK